MLGPMRSDLGEVGLPFVVAAVVVVGVEGGMGLPLVVAVVVVVVVVEGGATPRIGIPSNRPEWTEV